MQATDLWPKLEKTFGKQKIFWNREEKNQIPSTTDRLIHYLVLYYSTPAIARKVIRVFNGIEDEPDFQGWNEVRIATVNQISKKLTTTGVAESNSWELAITIKDFLQNAWDTLFTCNLTNIPEDKDPLEISNYIKQLRGTPNTWGKDNPTPYRPSFSSYNRKKHRKSKEPILPNFIITYLKHLWGVTTKTPYEYYADRALLRLGFTTTKEPFNIRRSKYHDLVGSKKPITKHKHLIRLGKTICLQNQPRCQLCPLSTDCASFKTKN
jgi:hypothetical protein